MSNVPLSNVAASVSGPDVPLRRQYLQIKQRYPDTVLFFRLGDFYETFDRDAETAAEVLDIVLTGREMGKGQRVPMAGIPYHAAESYIGRLVAAGHKVAICEQIGEVSKGKGLVERDVTRVVTPGTVVDSSMLDERANNFLAAAVFDGRRAGIAYADITTGEFATTELSGGDEAEVAFAAGRELLRLGAVELVVPVGLPDYGPFALATWAPEEISRSQTEVWRWRLERADEALRRHFGVESLDGFGCAGKTLAIRAAGGLLQYLEQTRLSGLDQITALSTYATDRFMTLDAQTRRNLELTESSRGDKRHSLVGVLDRGKTPMGARLLRRWLSQPLLALDELLTRQDGIAYFHAATATRSTLRQALGSVGDLERLVNRAVTGIATPRDMGQLRASLAALPAVASTAGDVPGAPPLPPVAGTHDLLSAALVDEPPAILGKTPALRPGFTSELDSHRARAQEARAWIAGLERSERERTGIKSLKVGYNKVFGYYLEITTAALANAERERLGNGRAIESVLPVEYIPKQTLINGTRYFTPQLKEFETVVLTAQETLAGIEADAFRQVCRAVAAAAPALLAVAQSVAYLDVIATLAEVAIERGYVRPELDDSGLIEIEAGRHPILESVLGRSEYVPNDAHLDPHGAQIIILTGPNMAGKSSWLRQVALITLLAQTGSFVPATRARIGLVDRIFTRIGSQDDIATGQSTFMVEMLETASILHHATPRSLVVLDEIGRGTSTYDGLAIARAVVEYLHNAPQLGCKTLFATHYHELTELDQILPRVQPRKMDVLEEGERVVFLRQVVPGGADRSYGIHVARLAGIPRGIVRRAQELLDDLESSGRGGAERALRREIMATPRAENESPTFQLTLFGAPNPALEALRELDIEALSPLDAITKLFDLRHMARSEED